MNVSACKPHMENVTVPRSVEKRKGSKRVYMGMPGLGLSGGKTKAAKDVVVLQRNTLNHVIRCQIFPVSLTYGVLLS